MKKFLLAVMAFVMGFAVASAKDTVIEPNQLPELAQKVLSAYFPDDAVAIVKMESGFFEKTEYDVRLVSGTEIDFDQAGNWTSVDCNGGRVPEVMLPDAVKAYMKTTANGAYVTEIERKLNGKCEIELSDGIEVHFDRAGNVTKTKVQR